MKITQAIHNSNAYIILEGKSGLTLTLSEVGAGIHDLVYKGRHLVETPLDKDLYETSTGYYGKSVGRVAGRLENAVLKLKGKEYKLEKNNGESCLHGGSEGVAFKRFKSDIEILKGGSCRVDFYLTSPDGEGGFPGEITLRVRYVMEDHEPLFRIETKAVAKGDTLLGFTNHSYFNLKGEGNILDHELRIASDKVMSYGDGLVPKGYVPLNDHFDFNEGKLIGKHIHEEDVEGSVAYGYDHNFRFREAGENAVKLSLIGGGLRMDVRTSFPSVQIYTDNFGDPKMGLTRGGNWERFGSVAIEPCFTPLDVEGMKIDDGKEQRTFIEYSFKEEGR